MNVTDDPFQPYECSYCKDPFMFYDDIVSHELVCSSREVPDGFEILEGSELEIELDEVGFEIVE